MSRVNFSKYTQNGPSILASASLVILNHEYYLFSIKSLEEKSSHCEVALSCIEQLRPKLYNLSSVLVHQCVVKSHCCLKLLFQWLSIPFAMSHDAVTSITETKGRWLGHWQPKHAGQWFDHAFLLASITLLHFGAAL